MEINLSMCHGRLMCVFQSTVFYKGNHYKIKWLGDKHWYRIVLSFEGSLIAQLLELLFKLTFSATVVLTLV